MKKRFARFITVITALLMVVTQLPINMGVDAEQLAGAPAEYPARTVVKLGDGLDYVSASPSAEETVQEFPQTVDLYSADYDYLEFDAEFISVNENEAVDFAVRDSQGRISTYNIDIPTDKWHHIKISTEDFTGNADLSDITGYSLENPCANVRYVILNICITGIMLPDLCLMPSMCIPLQ